MLMALTPVVASNMAPRSRFSPSLASPCLVLPPWSSAVTARLTCLHLITLLVCPSILLWFCFFVSCPRCSNLSDMVGGKDIISFSLPIFLPIKEHKVSNDSFFILVPFLDEHIIALLMLEFIFYFVCVVSSLILKLVVCPILSVQSASYI